MNDLLRRTRRVVVRVRHSIAPSIGSNDSKTLTLEGVQLANSVSYYYRDMIKELETKFGPAVYACSELPRALITGFLVTGAENIQRDPRLSPIISITSAPAPEGSSSANFYEHYKAERSVEEIVKQIALNPPLLGDQPVKKAMEMNMDFMRNFQPESRLVISFEHEPAISVFAGQQNIPAEDLGLCECEAIIFFMDDNGSVIGGQKFSPPVF